MAFPFDDDLGTADEEAMKAAALRRQMDAGLIAQLSGVRRLQPFGQQAISSAENQMAQAQAEKQAGLQRQINLAKMVADAREKAIDNARQQVGLEETMRHNRWNEAHPQQIVQFGQLPGAAPGSPDQGVLIDPRTGKTKQLDLTRAAKPGAAGGANSEKEWKEFTEKLGTGARGTLAKDLQKSLNSAGALEALVLGPGGDINNLNPQQVREAYTALNNLISKGGSQAVSQIEHLVPETLASKTANWKQYLLNEPQGADAQAFLRNLIDTVAREKKVAQQQMRAIQLQSLPNYAHLRKADQKRYESVLKGVGIDPASVDENGLDLPAQAAPSAGFSPEKKARLEELRRKRAAGDLK